MHKASTKFDALKTNSGVFENTPELVWIERQKGTPVPFPCSPRAIGYTADRFSSSQSTAQAEEETMRGLLAILKQVKGIGFAGNNVIDYNGIVFEPISCAQR